MIRNFSTRLQLPRRTPIVSTTGTPQAAISLPLHIPPDGRQAIAWPDPRRLCFTRLNSVFGLEASSGFWGRPNPPADLDPYLALGR